MEEPAAGGGVAPEYLPLVGPAQLAGVGPLRAVPAPPVHPALLRRGRRQLLVAAGRLQALEVERGLTDAAALDEVPGRLRDLLTEDAAVLPLELAHHLDKGLLPHQSPLFLIALLLLLAHAAARRRDALDAARRRGRVVYVAIVVGRPR